MLIVVKDEIRIAKYKKKKSFTLIEIAFSNFLNYRILAENILYFNTYNVIIKKKIRFYDNSVMYADFVL